MVNIRRKVVAGVLVATCMFSTSAMIATPVSAATNDSSQVIETSIESFFGGADMFLCVICESHPVLSVLGGGLLGAFRTYLGTATGKEITNEEVIDEIKNLSDKLDDYHNEEMNKLDELILKNDLSDFFSKLNSLQANNRFALREMTAQNLNEIRSERGYENLIKKTADNNNYVEYFSGLTDYVSGKSGTPVLDRYIELLKKKENDAEKIKAQAESFLEAFYGQYTVAFLSLMTGSTAKYDLAQKQYANGKITYADLQSAKITAKAEIDEYLDCVKKVADYNKKAKRTIDNLNSVEVTKDGKSVNFYSLADAWASSIKSSDDVTLKLLKDYETDNLSADINNFATFKNSSFKNGGLMYSGSSHKITLDLNGHKLINTAYSVPAVYVMGSNLEIKDSASEKGCLGGIDISGGKVDINNVVISGGTNTGVILNDKCTVNINDSTIKGYSNSGIKNYSSKLTVNNSVISNNTSGVGGAGGGGIDNESFWDYPVLNNCVITGNKSYQGGGGVYTTSAMTFNNCTIAENNASSNGGGIRTYYYGGITTPELKLNGCRLYNNNSGINGGGIYGDSMFFLTIYDTAIERNSAKLNGGGIYAQKGKTSSCDPVVGGTVTIRYNVANNRENNVFLEDGTFSKCILKVLSDKRLDSSSRIGVTSNTKDKSLDVVKFSNESVYNNTQNVFSYDNGGYRINRYRSWFTNTYWAEIKRA